MWMNNVSLLRFRRETRIKPICLVLSLLLSLQLSAFCKSGTELKKEKELVIKVVNETVSNGLETNILFINHKEINVCGNLSWKVIDSSNTIVESATRTITVPPTTPGYKASQSFFTKLPPGIFRIVCVFRARQLKSKVVDESYYSTIRFPVLSTQVPKQPKVNYLIQDVFKDISAQNQSMQGYIKDHLNMYLNARFNTNETAVLSDPLSIARGNEKISISLGTYLSQASMVYRFTHDKQLKQNIDSIAYTLTHTQERDGFLGIRNSVSFWSLNDIITLKNNIAGLLVYYQISGYKPALKSAILAANLVNQTFGNKAGNRALFSIGKLSASSIIGPMLDLYVQTSDQQYLKFCLSTLQEMELTDEPRLISKLTASADVDLTDISMGDLLENLMAILKLYRITGNEEYLNPCNAAWQAIVADPALLTTSAKKNENLNVLDLWTRFNAEFALSTGEISYFNQIDQAVYSGKSIILPYFPVGLLDNHPVVINYETGNFKEEILSYDGTTMSLSVNQHSSYPNKGNVILTLNPSKETSFTLALRRPAHSIYYKAIISGKTYTVKPDHFLNIQRFWKKGDQIEIQFQLLPPYLTPSQELDAYDKEAMEQSVTDKTIKIHHQIRRSW